jgi:hypothetical protein
MFWHVFFFRSLMFDSFTSFCAKGETVGTSASIWEKWFAILCNQSWNRLFSIFNKSERTLKKKRYINYSQYIKFIQKPIKLIENVTRFFHCLFHLFTIFSKTKKKHFISFFYFFHFHFSSFFSFFFRVVPQDGIRAHLFCGVSRQANAKSGENLTCFPNHVYN